MSKISSVVIVGRMNVGKSTLFNRLSTSVKSITLDFPGVTRDFIKDRIEWKGVFFDLIDSGGISLRKTKDPILEKVQGQVLELISSSEVVLFMVDGIAGLMGEDREISKLLHKINKPVILVVNKYDSSQAKENLYEFEKLGYSTIIPISAGHGSNIVDLLDAILDILPKKVTNAPSEETSYKVMFLGKPNVGKSSLMNALLNEERSFVSEIPGTTREAVSEHIMFYKEAIMLTDTPGIRRKRAVSENLEQLMVKSAFNTLKNSDIVVLLIDGSESGLVDQELKLAFYAFTQYYKGLILLINKQDLMTEANKKDLESSFSQYPQLIKKISVLYVSCKSGKNVGRVLPLVHKLWQRYSQSFDNSTLRQLFISNLLAKPLYHKTLLLRVYEVEQIKTAPITIVLTVNESDWFGPSQLAFFENILRTNYDLVGVPIKFIVKKAKEA